MVRSYPSKLLLLGEYTILHGSEALALPFKRFHGHWSFSAIPRNSDAHLSHQVLSQLINITTEQYIDLGRLEEDLSRGLWFDSNIPQGYGIGSSGALVAAIYDRYGKKYDSLKEIQNALARLEDFFHGSSSGIDPLVSLLDAPILIHHFNEVEFLTLAPVLKDFFLLNTQTPRQSGPLVSIYQEKMKDPHFKQGCSNILCREVNMAIESLFKKDSASLFHHLWLISKFQWDFFPEMIPQHVKELWSKGLESGDYILKLCGAGGGGFILAYSDKLSPADKIRIFGSHELLELS